MSKVKDSGWLEVTETDIAAAIKELEDIKAHPERYPVYNTVDEWFNATMAEIGADSSTLDD